jgi:hypothetical protein
MGIKDITVKDTVQEADINIDLEDSTVMGIIIKGIIRGIIRDIIKLDIEQAIVEDIVEDIVEGIIANLDITMGIQGIVMDIQELMDTRLDLMITDSQELGFIVAKLWTVLKPFHLSRYFLPQCNH